MKGPISENHSVQTERHVGLHRCIDSTGDNRDKQMSRSPCRNLATSSQQLVFVGSWEWSEEQELARGSGGARDNFSYSNMRRIVMFKKAYSTASP